MISCLSESSQNKKTPASGQQQFYPIPPKAVIPNHAPRKLDHTLNPRTANALRNVERSQWTTTYNRAHAGYGPANTLDLDNLEDKMEMEKRLRIEDHSLVGIPKWDGNYSIKHKRGQYNRDARAGEEGRRL